MSARQLQAGDRVAFRVNGRRFTGVVQDFLPFMREEIPVRKRTQVYWLKRAELRKLPRRAGGVT
jgi:hypothetical protein